MELAPFLRRGAVIPPEAFEPSFWLRKKHMFLLAIDPGVSSGFAVFDINLKLVTCGLSNPRKFRTNQAPFDRVVIEHPMIYPHGRTPDPNSIVKLAANAGEWAGRFGDYSKEESNVRYVFPRDWKGTINPDVCNQRVWSALELDEQNTVDLCCKGMAPSKRHNVLDAIGIGLFAINRWRT